MEILAFGGSFFVSQQGKLMQNEREEEEMMSEIAHKIGTIAWSDHLSITDEQSGTYFTLVVSKCHE